LIHVLRRSFLFVAFFLASAAESQGQLQKATVTYSSRSISSIDLFIAQDRGFFREEGLEARLVQVRATVAIAAILSDEVHALGSIGSAMRATERGAPVKVLAVSLRRPLFWLVTRPEIKSISELKGKVVGVVTLGGSQHTALKRILQNAAINPDSEVTTVLSGDVPAQLQALAVNSIQAAALSPPFVIVARDKFKMNVLASAMNEFTSLQNGLATSEKTLRGQRELVKRLLRARAKANRYFHENEKGSGEVLAKYLSVEYPTAIETYRQSRPAYTTDGIPTEDEVREYLKMDAQILGLAEPIPISKVFDFSLQREVNQELGFK
jgi:NitT/TauT family transport system substrate-binding protein